MKSKKIRFRLFLICILISASIHAEEAFRMSVNVATAGTLATILGNKVDSVAELTLTGELNGTDIKTLRAMHLLSVLNLADSKLVSGGEAYYSVYNYAPMGGSHTDYYYTSNNVLSSWCFYGCSRLTSLTLPNSITSIAGRAMSSCGNLTSITIPNKVTTIGSPAFDGCSRLTTITIPNSVTSLGTSSFANCPYLTTLFIPSSVLTVNVEAYTSLTGLTKIEVEAGNPNYCSIDGVLFNKDKTSLVLYPQARKMSTYSIPEGVVTIEASAFGNCREITTVKIPNSVTTLNDMVFYNCINLSSIVCEALTPPIVKNSVFVNVNNNTCKLFLPLASIGTYKSASSWSAFPSTSLEESRFSLPDTYHVTVPGTLSTLLGNKASTIRNLTLSGDLNGTDIATIRSMNSLSMLNLVDANIVSGGNAYYSNYYTSNNILGDSFFYGCKGLTSIVLPKTVTSIGDQAFDDGILEIHSTTLVPPTIKSTTFSAVNKSLCKIFVRIGAFTVYPSTLGWSDFNNYILEDTNTYDLPLTLNVPVAGTLTTLIGSCSNFLKDLTLTGNLNGSDIAAIRHMTYLSKLNLADASIVAGGDPYCIWNSPYLYTPLYSSNNTIGDNTFGVLVNLNSIILPNNLTTIGKSAFSGCSALTTVTLPNGVTSIGENAFHDCYNLTNITLPNSLTAIGMFAFSHCAKITSLTLPIGVTAIGKQAFEYCTSLASINLPNGITSISLGTFYECTALKTIILPKSVITVGASAFFNCSGLTEIYCKSETPPSVESQSSSPFDFIKKGSCNLNIPKATKLTYASATGWSYFSNIVEESANPIVTIHVEVAGTLSSLLDGQVASVQDLTLSGYLNGSDITTIRSLNNLSVLNLNDANIVSGGNAYYPMGPQYPYYTSDNEIGQYFFNTSANLTSLILPKNVVAIREGAFMECKKLVTMTIPNTVSAIDSYAFLSCVGLNSIIIPENVVSIGSSVFGYCTGLKVITLPNCNLSVGLMAFQQCVGLKEIHCNSVLPQTITSVTFEGLNKSNCTLFLPLGTVPAYQLATGWSEFPNMTDGVISSINNQKENAFQVYAEKNSLVVNGAQVGDEISVSSISGSTILRKKVTESNFKLELPGNTFYLIHHSNKSYKIIL